MKVHPAMKLKVFVYDITSCLEGNKELPEIAEEFFFSR